MKQELYNQIFARMDDLGSIREYEDEFFYKKHKPILSDCLKANKFINSSTFGVKTILDLWELEKPYLYEQSDEL